MPLERKNEVVQATSGAFLQDGSPLCTITRPYIPIYQWGYGRIDSSTPAKGLATCRVASCTVVIFHCQTTGRTVMSHSPNFLQMLTFVPMIDWVSGGTADGLDNMMSRLVWKGGPVLGPFNIRKKSDGEALPVLEVVVLRGRDYATEMAKKFGHAGWMTDLRRLCSEVEIGRNLKFNIRDDDDGILPSGAVLVDKETGQITTFTVVLNGKAKKNNAILDIKTSIAGSIDPEYTEHHRRRDLFIGNFLYEVKRDVVDLHLQWDVNRYRSSIPLPDEARLLLRQKMGTSFTRVERRFNMQELKAALSAAYLMCLEDCMVMGMPCEICGKQGGQRCSRCGGAWYCDKQHQTEDWAAHKKWCKANALPEKQ